MKNINKEKNVFSLFLLQIVLSFFFELFFKRITWPRLFNLTENILFIVLIIVFSFLIPKIKMKTLFLKASIIIFNLSLLFETLYYYLFNTVLDSSAIFVVLETNISEANEFLFSRFDEYILIYIVLLALITVNSIRLTHKISFPKVFLNISKFNIKEILLLMCFLFKITKLITFNVPYLMVKAPITYFQEMKKFETYGRENFYGNFTKVEHKVEGNKKELYLVVIGESTNKLHFQLYKNYYRETTPLLNGIKDELFVFEDIISPHTYTIGSLSKALTLGNYENLERKYEGSIIQLFNQAKFKTYWISNQRPVGMMDTHVTKIGIGAYKSFFINTKHTNDDTSLDSELFNVLENVLLEEGDRKIIFMHMLGTHMNYKKRYPKNFEYFKNTPKTKFKKDKAYNTINAYDNAIRYNDFLLKNVIEIIRQEGVNSYVLYFSDHGQEVFDEIDFYGHTIDEQITKNMYEIPMFLWVSEYYKAQTSLNINLNKKYMTDDLIHSIADISNVNSQEVDSSRSIFSKYFKERKRIIKDTINYDTFFQP